MIRIIFTWFALLVGAGLLAQDKISKDTSKWEFGADANLYLIPEDVFFLPVFRADREKLHLEARYNYEDRETLSAWVGYNFSGGKKLEYALTPMLGGVVDLSDGIAAGLEMTLGIKRYELYSEQEYFIDPRTTDNSFFYMWTDLTYAPKEWLWFGISGQRTRLYQTDLDLQRGLLVGAAWRDLELSTYLYNLGFDEAFVLLSLSVSF
jgi:hypothetical protein